MQWHLAKTIVRGNVVDQHIGIIEAWKLSTGSGITIAVIDDGVDIDHEEFAGKDKIVAPRDTLEDTDNPRPKYASERHGTACAGVACANGSKQAAGVAPGTKLMPIRSGNLGSLSEAMAFAWAADHGADIISCSWGPTDGYWANPTDLLHSTFAPLFDSTRLAIDYAVTQGRQGRGCVITWAAGNGNENVSFDGYASYDKVIAVAACNDRGTRSIYSDYGKAIWCCFPSDDFEFPPFNHPAPATFGIWTTDRSGTKGYNPGGTGTPEAIGDTKGLYTATFGGTSSACPGAAGVSALILSINPHLTWLQVKELLKASCDQIDAATGNYDDNGHSIYYGFGRLNALRAVILATESRSEIPDLNLVGKAHFTGYGVASITNEVLVGGFKSRNRMSGLSLQLSPLHPQIGITYQVSFNGLKKTYKGADGVFAGVTDKRRMAIGISVSLTGPLASKYAVRYGIRTSRGSKWIRAENGSWCGVKSGLGAGICQIQIRITPV
jgi:subtilisin family serine protease